MVGGEERGGLAWALRDGLVLLTAAVIATVLAMAAVYFLR